MKKRRYLTSVSIGAATVWFSTHCGAGFASGTQETAYFVASGWLAPFMTIISQVLMGIIVWVGCESARLHNTFTYGDLSRKIYAPHEKILSATYELMAPISAIMAAGACIAGGASVISQNTPIPQFWGTIIMFVGIILITTFGAKLVRAMGTYMTIGIIIIVLIVMVLGVKLNWDNICEIYANRTMWITPGKAVWNGFLYGFFNMAMWGVAASAAVGMKTREEAKGTAVFGTVLNIIMLASVTLMLLGGAPFIMEDAEASTLPTLYIVKSINSPFLSVCYPILLFLAYITTAVGNTFMIQERFKVLIFEKKDKAANYTPTKRDIQKRNFIITLIFLLVAFGASQFGLVAIINKGYRFNGYVFIFTVAIPFLTIGIKNIKKFRAKEDAGELKHLLEESDAAN